MDPLASGSLRKCEGVIGEDLCIGVRMLCGAWNDWLVCTRHR